MPQSLSSSHLSQQTTPPQPLQRPHVASAEEMASFHSDDYVDFLRRVTPETAKSFQGQMQKCAFFLLFRLFDEYTIIFTFSRHSPPPPLFPPFSVNCGEFTDCK